MPWRCMKALAKSFDDSSCAASLVGPNTFRPRARNRLTMPPASGVSGPTTVSAIFSWTTKLASSCRSVMARFCRRESRAVPPLPGATYTIWIRSDCASFHARACSRPPEPTTNIFIIPFVLYVEYESGKRRPRGRRWRRGASVFDQRVGVDLLHVVEVFQRVHQLLHLDRVVSGEDGFGGRLHDDLGHFGLESGRVQRVLDGGEIERRAQHFKAAFLVGDDVFGARFQRRLHQRVLVHAGREQELAAVLEHEGHRIFGAHIAAMFVERVAYLGHGAHTVVGHAVDDDGRAADAVAIVADLLVGRAVVAAHARGDRDFLDQSGPDLAALGVRRGFFMLDVGPFAVSSHVRSSLGGMSVRATF